MLRVLKVRDLAAVFLNLLLFDEKMHHYSMSEQAMGCVVASIKTLMQEQRNETYEPYLTEVLDLTLRFRPFASGLK
jgi:hypothetical protein